MRVEYPIALDSNYAIWRAFNNRYWPAVYIADEEGRIRHQQFGEGGYEECERIIQRLLGIEDGLVSVADDGFEAQADWANLQSPETYLGYEQAQNFAGDAAFDESHTYLVPEPLNLNEWALSGDWTVASGASILNGAEGGIAFRFHARDVNLVMGPPARGESVPFGVLVDGEPPGDAHGLDVHGQGQGTVAHQRLYRLIREPGSITDRTFQITFLGAGVEGSQVATRSRHRARSAPTRSPSSTRSRPSSRSPTSRYPRSPLRRDCARRSGQPLSGATSTGRRGSSR
jgi:Thioredoxin like C-terminal domain